MTADRRAQIPADDLRQSANEYLRRSASMEGQATLELTAALLGMLVLLFGSLKVCLWVGERFVKRQQTFERTRVAAGSDVDPGRLWDEPAEELRIFREFRIFRE